MPRSKNEDSIGSLKTAGRKPNMVWLSDSTKQLLKKYMKDNNYANSSVAVEEMIKKSVVM